MKRASSGAIALLAITLLAPVRAGADPHDIAGPPESATPEMIEGRRLQAAGDAATLLRRLVGMFDVDGVFGNVAASGKADCVAIGSGPGVQCVFHVVWGAKMQGQGPTVRRGDSFLAPAAFLFGFDPNEGAVRTMQLDTSGLAEDMTTILGSSNTLTWCAGEKRDWCYRAYAPLERRDIQITLYVGNGRLPILNLHMQRITTLP